MPQDREDSRVALRARNTGTTGPAQFSFYWAVSSSEWVSDFSGNPETLITKYGFVDGPDIERHVQAGETVTVVPDRRPPEGLKGTQVVTIPLLLRIKVRNVGFAGRVRVTLLNKETGSAVDSLTVSMAEDSTSWVSFEGAYGSLIGGTDVEVKAESAVTN